VKSADEIDNIWNSTPGLGPKTKSFVFQLLGLPLNAPSSPGLSSSSSPTLSQVCSFEVFSPYPILFFTKNI
jgi:hypothetical protein